MKYLVLAAALGLATAFAASAQPVCTDEHAPVCGLVRPSGPQTFDNACRAKVAGAPVLHDGACVGAGQTHCPRNDAAPVCAKAPSAAAPKTYDNLCWAEKDWATLIHKGVCK